MKILDEKTINLETEHFKIMFEYSLIYFSFK